MFEQEREHIDHIDQHIVALFEERMQIIGTIAQTKKDNDIEVLDEEREAQIMEQVTSYLKDETLTSGLQDLYKELFRISRQRQLLIMDEALEE